MKTIHIQILTGILQLIWSLPIIGIILVVHPLFPVSMGVIHTAAIGAAVREQKQKTGNVVGLIACILSVIAAVNMRAFSGLGSEMNWVVTWPVHVCSTIYIFRDVQRNRKKTT